VATVAELRAIADALNLSLPERAELGRERTRTLRTRIHQPTLLDAS
jgi:hypothetical protein